MLWFIPSVLSASFEILWTIAHQVRILEWVAVSFSRGSSRPRGRTRVSFTGRQILYHLSHLGSPFRVYIVFSLLAKAPYCFERNRMVGLYVQINSFL